MINANTTAVNTANVLDYEAWIEGLAVIRRSEMIWGLTRSSIERVKEFIVRGEEAGYEVPATIRRAVAEASADVGDTRDPNKYIKKRMLASIVKAR